MKEIRNNNTVLSKILLTLISILLALSGMAAITSADIVTPIRFYGNVSHDGVWAQPGTVIEAYVGGELSSIEPYTVTEERSGVYYIDVLSDEGGTITFTIDGDTADQTDTWHASTSAESRPLDISTGDLPAGYPLGYEPPSGTSGGFGSPDATTTGDVEDGTGDVEDGAEADGVTSTQSDAAPASTPTESTEGPDTESGTGTFPWWILVAIAGLLVVVVIIYLIKQKG